MPIPFLLAGAALIAGGYGIKKGIDAKQDFDKAESLNKQARTIFDDAAKSLEDSRQAAQNSMEKLGSLKFKIYEDYLVPFVEAFSKIKHIDFQDQRLQDEFKLTGITNDDILAISKTALDMKQVVGGGITALGAGGLAGLAAYGSVGVLASTAGGTTIASLSGVAATNATLAWLGGGALSAGGLGMAGGTAVLGGIVAGPVLAVGGMMLASKAEEAKQNAYSNLDKARVEAEQMQTAETATNGIEKRFIEISSVLTKISDNFLPLLRGLQQAVANNTDFRTYSTKDRQGIMMSANTAKTLKNILEAPILDSNGALTEISMAIIQGGNKKLEEIRGT